MFARIRCRLLLLCTAACLCLLAAPQGRAQLPASARPALPAWLDSTGVTIAGRQVTLADAIDVMCAQTGRSIIAMDTPLRGSADFDVHGTAASALDIVCKAFDYTWSVNQHGIVVLTKAFADPADYPQPVAGEIAQVLSDLASCVQSAGYTPGQQKWDALTARLFSALSADQVALLRLGGALAWTQLSPAQQGLLQSAITQNSLDDLGAALRAAQQEAACVLPVQSGAYLELRTLGAGAASSDGVPGGEMFLPAMIVHLTGPIQEFDYIGLDRDGQSFAIPLFSRPPPPEEDRW